MTVAKWNGKVQPYSRHFLATCWQTKYFIIVTSHARINHLSAKLDRVIFLPIFSVQNVVSYFCKLQKKHIKFCCSDIDFVAVV